MILNDRHKSVLLEVLRRSEEQARVPSPPRWQTWAVADWEFAQINGPEYRVRKWFGADHPSDQKSYLRDIRDLERWGLTVTAARWGRRLSHVRLTESGLALAEDLATRPATE